LQQKARFRFPALAGVASSSVKQTRNSSIGSEAASAGFIDSTTSRCRTPRHVRLIGDDDEREAGGLEPMKRASGTPGRDFEALPATPEGAVCRW
jgi:hypothetical protein